MILIKLDGIGPLHWLASPLCPRKKNKNKIKIGDA